MAITQTGTVYKIYDYPEVYATQKEAEMILKYIRPWILRKDTSKFIESIPVLSVDSIPEVKYHA